MTDIYSSLAWLPRPPDDIAARLRALASDDAPEPAARVRALAGHALDSDQFRKLAAAMAGMKARGTDLAPLKPFRLGVASNATPDLFLPSLTGTAARYGLDLELYVSPYGAVMQEVMDEGSGLYRFRPDAILFAIDHHGLAIEVSPGRADPARAAIEAAVADLNAVRQAAQTRCGALCIAQTLPRPPETLFGSLDFVLPGTMRTLIEGINRGLAASLSPSRDALLDVAGIAETVGLANWQDPALWNMAKAPFNLDYAPLYAEHLFRLINAVRGGSRKVLALDLDNTVWGGVIGDDGLEGIRVAQGDPTGEAHLDVQQTALNLRGRGVVLAVSSKNNDDQARAPFHSHPDMLLREDHIAVLQANWDDKASNLAAIARELNVGIDAVAFLDDNPMERDLVRTMLPAVAVPELPEDPALFARTLLAAGYFESAALTEEDYLRADLYQRGARRASLQRSANSIEDYLRSLDMKIFLAPFDAAGRARIAQLINKSNQFNLTTRRYTEAEVAAAEADPEAFTVQVRLTDIFGDNGMIGVVICRADGPDWLIDTWLMSCRVLGRKVEEQVLNHIAQAAGAAGAQQLVGHFIPSAKNSIVADHYAKLGFVEDGPAGQGGARWVLDIATFRPRDVPMVAHALQTIA